MNFDDLRDEGNKLLERLESENKKIILYGTGSIGNYVYGAIQGKVDIAAYCVSENKSNQSMYNDIPVYEVNKLPYPVKECLFLLTLDQRHWDSVKRVLEKIDAVNVLPIGVLEQNELLAVFYNDYFLENDIDISQDILEINGIKMKNPLKLQGVDLDAVLIEMNDLILGDIFGDYRLLSEGPYLYGGCIPEQGDIVLDCGTNLGLFSVNAASRNCKVYSFEPTKRLYEQLGEYKEIYGDAIEPVNAALSDKDGIVEFSISDKWDVANTIVFEEDNSVFDEDIHYEIVEVECMTVDSFVKKNNLSSVDYIKADIEGAERYMLRGARETLKKFAPKLSICTYHFSDDPEVLEKIILDANPQYKIEHRWKKLYAVVNED